MNKVKVFILLALSGCATQAVSPQQVDSNKEYRLDLVMKINQLQGRGMLSVPRSTTYQIEVQAPGDSELVTINSCHREQILEKQDDKFTINFTPTSLEASGYCLVKIQAFSPKFKYSAGVLDFADADGLQAHLLCNGKAKDSMGTSVCQSREGNIQKISFDVPVRAAEGKSGCPNPSVLEGREFEVRLGTGLCVYAFKYSDGRMHRLTTNGYTEFRLGIE